MNVFADPNIIMQDTSAKFDTPQMARANYLKMQNDEQSNQLNQLTLADKQRAFADENQLAQLTRQFGNDPVRMQQALFDSGNLKGAQSYIKTQADAKKAGLDAEKTGNEVISQKMTLARDQLNTVSNPQQAAQWVTAIFNDPNTGPFLRKHATLDEAIGRIGQDQASFNQWKMQSGSNAEKIAEMTKPQSADSMATERTATAGRLQSDQHYNTTRQDGFTQGGKPPPGYRVTANGNLQSIPGGPADLKLQGALNQDTQTLNGGISSMDRLSVAANEILQHPGLKGIYGLRGMVPNIPGTDAADAAALLQTLKSQVGFGVLQDMRNNSKTGGALGAVSDAENKMLQSNLAALDKAQSVEQAVASLKKIIAYSGDAKDRLRGAYNMKHSDSVPSSQDSAAVAWAKANPNDPRAAKIMQLQGR